MAVKMTNFYFLLFLLSVFCLVLNLSPSMNTFKERKPFFKHVSDKLKDCGSSDYVVLGGGLNCTENKVLDRKHTEQHLASQQALRQLVSPHGLVDVWRRAHASSRQFTWPHISENRISLARLDRFFHCLKHHFSIFKTCKISPVGFTHHALLLCCVFTQNI